jgi:hypothetical protein
MKTRALYYYAMALAVLLVATACRTTPSTKDTRIAVEATMGDARTHAAIDDFVGHPPERCVRATERDEICAWLVTGRSPAWRPLAETIPTSDRLNLLCVVPTDGSPRAAASCSVHPRRSDRQRWSPSKQAGAGHKGKDRGPNRAQVRDELAQKAQGEIDDARTLADLSRLMGAAPDECLAAGDVQTCVWRATSQTFGHGLVAASIKASMRKKVRLTCVVPLDGGPRGANSCTAVIGA